MQFDSGLLQHQVMDHTKIYMITGANRGIGLGFTRHYLQQGHRIIATHRNDSKELMALQTEFPSHLILITMDVLLAASIQQAFTNITSAVTHIDVLINNAGRYGSDQATITEKLDIEDMVTTFRTNSLAPL
ncbi:MAG: SDR family NAD(P)-dependent oxidoreductase, partial [Deltaproteobacteria bacterium]|nr:SDR family NAD(P)-dependent oxidoreductase [Deltaproteobacteria bacterium]